MSEPDDPYLWLEDVTGDAALEWVRARNDDTVAMLADTERWAALRDDIRGVLDADDRIPYATMRGEYLYNFWRDADHPRGVWRRTTLAEYRKEHPDWHVVLDVDALAEQEGENWVWQAPTVLRPEHRRCLINLSRGGADATVVREFDLDTCTFVADGFALPEAKSRVAWIDIDRVYVGTDFGEGSLTTSGYPRVVKQWRRGTPLSDAEIVFEGKPEDVAVSAFHDATEGFERDFVHRLIDFYTAEFERTGFTGGLNWYRAIDLSWELMGAWHGAPLLTPALYIAGDRDGVVSFPGMRELIKSLKVFTPKLRDTIMLEGCGQWTQQERPDEVNAALIGFLKEL
jgi:prolyl oligopeptidase